MTKTLFMQRRCVQKCAISTWLPWCFLQLKSKNPCPCRNCTHFPNWCIIRTRKALGLWSHASQTLMMHLIRKYAIFAWAWVLAIITCSNIGQLGRRIMSTERKLEYFNVVSCTPIFQDSKYKWFKIELNSEFECNIFALYSIRSRSESRPCYYLPP